MKTPPYIFTLLLLISAFITTKTTLGYFDAAADPKNIQSFSVEGLVNQACGTVYPDGVLEHGGMPLGGLGTGYFCVDTDGRLGKISILNRLPAPMVFGSPFFFLETGGERLTLATPKYDKDGNITQAGDVRSVDYFGHYPVVDMKMTLDRPIGVRLRAFSPFIPGDAVTSNTPVAFFEVVLTNDSKKTQKMKLIFAPHGFPAGKVEDYQEGDWAVFQTTHLPVEPMPDWARHTYALGAENGATEKGTAFVECEILPGASYTARFILAWNQPFLREGSGRIEKNYYAQRFENSKAVVADSLKKRESWLARILAAQDVIYGSDYPDWLKEALITAPYALVKNAVWLAKTRPDDWWGDEGMILINESFISCPIMDTMPCRYLGHWYQLFFMPETLLNSLKNTRYFQLQGGQPPFSVGMGFAIRDPRYHCQHTGGAGEYPMMIYHYYLRTGDRKFLEDYWPSAKKSLEFMLSLDMDGDGLIEDHVHAVPGETFPANNPLDQWPWHGVASYTAGRGLAFLASGIKMAEIMGDPELAAQWREIYEKGQKSYEEKLWNGKFYRTYSDPANHRVNESSFSAQLSGVWCARVVGLPDTLPEQRIHSALDNITRLNLRASQFGTVNAVFDDGTICTEGGYGLSIWSRGNFIQLNATAAGVYLYHGRAEEGLEMGEGIMNTVFRGPHAMPWSQPCGLDMDHGFTCHGYDYLDHVVVWTYPMAIDGKDIPEMCAPGGFIQAILDAAGKAGDD